MPASDMGDYSRVNIFKSLLKALALTNNNKRDQFKGDRLAVGLIGKKERSTVSSREKQRDSSKFQTNVVSQPTR